MKLRTLIIGLIVVVAVNVAAHFVLLRWDMTEDKRYSLSESTKVMLRSLEEPLTITSMLKGDLNSGFQRLEKAEQEIEQEFKVYSPKCHVQADEALRLQLIEDLHLRPTIIHEREKDGKTAQTEVYPYVVLSYKGRRAVLPLLSNNRSLSGEENLNNSIAGLEYAFAEGLHQLLQDSVSKIAFLEGHGELDERYVWDAESQLSQYFTVERGALSPDASGLSMLKPYKVVVIADPQGAFSDEDKFIIDQYIMQGGRVLWLLNGVQFSTDVLTTEGFTPAIALDLRLSDMLFRYGVRIDPALVQDQQCLPVPVNVSTDPTTPNYQPLPWYYAPLLLTSYASPITRNCMQVSATFASPVEAVGGEDGIRKNILLATSTASRLIGVPAQVDLTDINPDLTTFKYSYIPVAMSLEGEFESFFKHRIAPLPGTKQDRSVPTRQVVMGSGSIIRNEWQHNQPLPAGYDRYSGMQFGNRDVIVNAVLWLADGEGLMDLRKKEVTLRLLNDQIAHRYRTGIQIATIGSPIAILALIALIVGVVRKKRYE